MSHPQPVPASGGISKALADQAKWGAVRTIIEDLYLRENLPEHFVGYIMLTLYNFSARKDEYRKKFPKKDSEAVFPGGVKKRTRAKVQSPRAIRSVAAEVMPLRLTNFAEQLVRQPTPLRYRLQESIMFSVHRFLDSIFKLKGKQTWSVNLAGFLSPDGAEAQAKTWFCIESLCDSASTLIRCNQTRQAHKLLLMISPHLDVLAARPDPLFLGKIWHLSLLLRSVDRRVPGLKALATLLGHLAKSCSALHGVESPMSVVVASIVDLDEADFTPTMGLGFRETLAKLDHKVKDENVAMLRLWSTYAQYFSREPDRKMKKKRVKPLPNPPKSEKKAKRHRDSITMPRFRLIDDIRRDILLRKFEVTREECNSSNQRMTLDNRILLSCYHAYAALWICENMEQGQAKAQEVIEGTKMTLSKRRPVWSIKTLAYVMATKVLAEIHHRRKEMEQCEQRMQSAIALLAKGDETCRIRAISMCLTLVAWRKGREAIWESLESENHLLTIQSGLEGFDLCANCRPSQKCESCFQDRQTCPKCEFDNGRNVCRTCKRARSRRDGVKQIQRERLRGSAPPNDTSAAALEETPSRAPSQTTALHRRFTISGLSPSLTYHELLGAIRETGRIFSSNIAPSITTPRTSTASIVFWDTTAADKFWQRHESQGLQVGEYSGRVTQSVLAYSQPSRDMPGHKKSLYMPSRVLVVTGLATTRTITVDQTEAEKGVRRRDGKRRAKSTACPTQEEVLAHFKESCSFEVDEIFFSKPGEATSLEVRFGSWDKQAGFCMGAHRQRWHEQGVRIKYGRDPCA